MTKTEEQFKSLRKLSFKDSTIEEILGEENKSGLSLSDEADFKRLGRGYFEVHNLPELREIAKNIGVASPCTYSKSDLVDRMMDLLWGLQYFSEEGAPLSDPDVKKLSPEDELKLLEDFKHGDYVLGSFVEGVFDGDESGGALRVNRFVKSVEDVGVIRRLINLYGLKSGDVVSGRARYVKNAGFFCLHYIDSVNGVKTDSSVFAAARDKQTCDEKIKPYQRILPSSGSDSGLLKLMDVFTPSALGQSVVISCSGKFSYSENAAKLTSSLQKITKVDEILFLCLGVSAETKQKLSSVFPSAVFTGAGDGDEDEKIVKRVRDYASAQAKCGKNVVVVLNNIDRACSLSMDGAEKLVDSAAQFATGGSFTLFAFADRDNTVGAYYRVKNLVSAELCLTSRAFYGDFNVELSRCFSNSGINFTAKEQAAFVKLRNIAVTVSESAALKTVLDCDGYEDVINKLSAESAS